MLFRNLIFTFSLKRFIGPNKGFYALTQSKNQLKLKRLLLFKMEGTHNYAMNLIVPLMGIAPLLMLFILKGEKKSKVTKNWTRSTN